MGQSSSLKSRAAWTAILARPPRLSADPPSLSAPEPPLVRLQSTLEADARKPTVALMHHPPFLSGVPYLDKYRYIEADPLESVLRPYSNRGRLETRYPRGA
jgi:hypothetical protein